MRLTILFLKLFTALPVVWGAPVESQNPESRDIIHSPTFHYNKDMPVRGKEQLKGLAGRGVVDPMILHYNKDIVEGDKERLEGLAERENIDIMIWHYDKDMDEESEE